MSRSDYDIWSCGDTTSMSLWAEPSLLHGAPVSEFFSGAMADVLKADDNQTGTAALGSSREPLF